MKNIIDNKHDQATPATVRRSAAREALLALLPLAAAAAFLVGLMAHPADAAEPGAPSVAGEKLDSGLGDLPPYAQWADPSGRQPLRAAVTGEKLDSGLGDLPPYSQWADPSGRQPLATTPTAQRVSLR